MAVDAKHPLFEKYETIWKMMRDCEEGEETVKKEGAAYLPMPSGFLGQNDGGAVMYKAYTDRAEFPDILQPTLDGMVGVIHRVDAKIDGLEDGKPLAYMWDRCTRDDKLPLDVFHRRITRELLLMGRYIVLTDVPGEDTPATVWEKGQPYFVGYGTEQLINWSEFDRDFFVLNETRMVRGDGSKGEDEESFAWHEEKRFRVLSMDFKTGKYQQILYTGNEHTKSAPITPTMRGNVELSEIPIVVGGPREVSARFIDQPPLKGVARASLSIYQINADYRHQLYMSGQETFVIVGEVENLPRYVGSGVVIGLPENSSAQYASPSCTGIEAHRTATLDARANAVAAGVRMFDTQAKAESGEALRLRGAAQTATLLTVALMSAAILEKALRHAAGFVGQKPEEIVVKPNLDFVDTKMTPEEAVKLMELWTSGAISYETFYENLQRGEIASGERTHEEERGLIEQEIVDHPLPSTAAHGDSNADPMFLEDGSGGGGPSSFIEDDSGLEVEET